MSAVELVELDSRPAAVVRSTVAMTELPNFLGRAFGSVMAAVAEQGVAVAGEPIALYLRPPGELIEIAAGFPVAGTFVPTGDVVPMDLPGGRAVTTIHVGPYDTMTQTYATLRDWMAAEGLQPAQSMWEVYLTEPDAEPDPSTWQTRIVWPVTS